MRSTLDHLQRIFIEPPQSYDTAIRHKARLLSIFLLVMIFIFTCVDITYVLTVPGYAVPWYGYVFLLISYALNRWGYYNIASGLVVFMFPAVIFFSIFSGQANNPVVSLSFLVLGLIVSSILLSARGVVLLAFVNLFAILMLPRLMPQSFPDLSVIIGPLAVLTISAALVLVSMWHRDQVESERQSLLRLSEERYRMLFEEAPDGILIVDGINRIVMANSVIYEMTGYTSDELIGRSPLDFVAPEDLSDRPPRPFEEIKVPGSMRRERTLIHKNGSRLNVVISSSYMPDGELQYIIQDVSERKQMEEALKASEEKFAKSFQSSPDAITISSIETGKFIDVNDGFCRMSGYSRAEALGRSAEELNIWEDVDQRRKMIASLERDGKVRDFETILKRKNGEPLTCLLSLESVEIGRQMYMVVITRDVTEQKRMEQELRLSEERYRIVSSVMSDYTFSAIRYEDGHLFQNWVAGAFEQITGYSLEEFNARGGWISIVHPDDIERDALEMTKLFHKERLVTEIRIIHKDGNIRWVRSYAHPLWDEGTNRLIGMYGAVQDITERKHIEQELRLSEERYRLVSSVISDYTFSNIQNEMGEIVLTWVAGAFEQISGYNFEEFNARGGWVSTIHPDDLEQDAHDMEMLRNNQQIISELRTIHKDGTIRWVKSYAHPVWDEAKNQLIGIYGAVQDVTDRKRIEQEREELIRDLEAKNQELEQFTYTVSHDLKAPIITIKGFLGFLGADALAGDKKRLEADIQRINDAADKMNELLTDLLELSRIGRKMNAPEMISFESLVNEVIETTHGRLQAGGVIVIVKGPFPNIYGDRRRLLEVVQNLMDNSAKFMGDQSSPQIEIGQDGRAEDGYATFFVRDNGIGIAPEFHERIFGLFNRLNPKIEGTGIGLALVKRIVEFHGGRVWIQSEAGSGATFYFTLPDAPIESV